MASISSEMIHNLIALYLCMINEDQNALVSSFISLSGLQLTSQRKPFLSVLGVRRNGCLLSVESGDEFPLPVDWTFKQVKDQVVRLFSV